MKQFKALYKSERLVVPMSSQSLLYHWVVKLLEGEREREREKKRERETERKRERERDRERKK